MAFTLNRMYQRTLGAKKGKSKLPICMVWPDSILIHVISQGINGLEEQKATVPELGRPYSPRRRLLVCLQCGRDGAGPSLLDSYGPV